MKSFMQTKETVTRNWYVIDAKDIALFMNEYAELTSKNAESER